MQIKALSVSEVNSYIKRILINDPILYNLQVKGEISNFKHHSSGHMYFSLKDAEGKISCIMFKTSGEKLKFQPKEGMKVVCRGYISLYERDGQYQLYVNQMEPLGIGALYLAFLQLKEKLEDEGLFNVEYKKHLPFLPRKIAVITSPTGAAIRDIISVLTRRFENCEIYVFPVLVQGEGAPESIIKAIELCNSVEGIDVAIVGRGGGAIEELWAFNDERVARAIFASNVPIISAVGHETDFTIADFVADLRAPTPSAAAELVIHRKIDLEKTLNILSNKMISLVQSKIDQQKKRIQAIQNHYYFKFPLNPIYDQQQHLDSQMKSLNRSMKRYWSDSRHKADHLGGRLHSLSPLAVLSRGYSFARNEQGHIINEVKKVKPRDKVIIDVLDGKIFCEVRDTLKEDQSIGRDEI